MEVEHVFASTNRQPKSCYWVQDESVLVVSATSSIVAYQIDTKHTNRTIACVNKHEHTITSMAGHRKYFATGDKRGTVILWKFADGHLHMLAFMKNHHADPVNNIDVLVNENDTEINVISSAGDGFLRLSGFNQNGDSLYKSEISHLPLYPLCCAISRLPTGQLLVAGAFDDYSLRFYLTDGGDLAEKCRTKIGEDWTIDLNFTKNLNANLKLAIANNDHLLRVMEIALVDDPGLSKNRLQVEKKIIEGTNHELRMETILQGHENWVTSSVWYHNGVELELGTCSMDKSVILWKPNETGIWEDYVRLGAVGGGNLGFLGIQAGKDSYGICGLLSYSYTGSVHLWWSLGENNWTSSPAPSGHYDSVRDVTWSPSGAYLLTTGYDQTTRLFAKYSLPGSADQTWAELARPQVHGHGIRCLSCISDGSFVSGAEEKVIRVFRATRNFHSNFKSLSGIELDQKELENVPEGAAVPALGLSNKAIFDKEGTVKADREISGAAHETYMSQQFTSIELSLAPKEEDLIQNSLWWEERKLYGHGAELQSIAVSPDQKWIASSCKATKLSQAVVIIWDASREGSPGALMKLEGHQLTVIQIIFNRTSDRILTVGRDRIAIVWMLTDSGWTKQQTLGKEQNGHTRLIWNGCWSKSCPAFYTVGRDKMMIKWTLDSENMWGRSLAMQFDEAVTAIDSYFCSDYEIIVVGFESGKMMMIKDDGEFAKISDLEGHASTVNQIRFNKESLLASCADDNTVKIFRMK